MITTVKILIQRSDDNLLAVRSSKYWTLPGGKIEPHENVVETLIREMQEELPGLLKFVNLLGYTIYNDEDVLYFARLYHRVPVSIGNEILEYKWMTIRQFTRISDYWKGLLLII